ncbi:MAG TPA: PfkB family carbohydrate kinase [Solirubrobacteraceae bacterium]|jgi:ribokinase
MRGSAPRVAVVGHVEWVEFALVDEMPWPGEIVPTREVFAEAAGGGAVAAVQLARLAGESVLVTALGEDDLGRRAKARLEQLGVHVRAAYRSQPTSRALTLVDGREGERTIVTIGERLEPSGSDAELGWGDLADMDAVYFTAGDVAALRAARAAAKLLASPRAQSALGHGVALDALVGSRADSGEMRQAMGVRGEAAALVHTNGEHGGSYELAGDRRAPPRTWEATAPPGPTVDSYGCGDSFAAALTYGLGCGWELSRALSLAARAGAACVTGRGPYERQLRFSGAERPL